MSCGSNQFVRCSSIFCCVILLFLTPGSAPAVDRLGESCAVEVGLPLNAMVRDVSAAYVSQCYAVEIPVSGILALAVSASGLSGVEPRLGGFGNVCGGPEIRSDELEVVERLAARQLLKIRTPGIFHFCVGTPDSGRALVSYKLHNLFTPTLFTKAGDPREEEPDPDPIMHEPTLAGLGGSCLAVAEDDHGDVFHCATLLSVGGAVDGELQNLWGDDEDLFVFRLGELATVRVEVASDGAVSGGLYDRNGHRLYVDVVNDRMGWHFIKTLTPGLYAVRLTGPAGLSGSYRLRLKAMDK